MFEIEDIYEFVDKEAFPSLNEFKDYANSGSAADIYEFVDKGAFATLDEFTSLLKKKTSLGIYLQKRCEKILHRFQKRHQRRLGLRMFLL